MTNPPKGYQNNKKIFKLIDPNRILIVGFCLVVKFHFFLAFKIFFVFFGLKKKCNKTKQHPQLIIHGKKDEVCWIRGSRIMSKFVG